jgi:hypothetical protein
MLHFSEVEKELIKNKVEIPFTWNIERLLRKSNEIQFTEGHSYVAAPVIYTEECTAASIAFAIQKLLVKSRYLNKTFLRPNLPHIAWIYGLAKKIYKNGKKELDFGTTIDQCWDVIQNYGIIWDDNPNIPKSDEVVGFWGHLNGISNDIKYDFLQYKKYAEKLTEIKLVKLYNPEQMQVILESGGTCVMTSLFNLHPESYMSDLIYVTGFDNAHRHTMPITDYDGYRNFYARWQVWGYNDEYSNYKSPNSDLNPHCMGWCSLDTFRSEENAVYYGLII